MAVSISFRRAVCGAAGAAHRLLPSGTTPVETAPGKRGLLRANGMLDSFSIWWGDIWVKLSPLGEGR